MTDPLYLCIFYEQGNRNLPNNLASHPMLLRAIALSMLQTLNLHMYYQYSNISISRSIHMKINNADNNISKNTSGNLDRIIAELSRWLVSFGTVGQEIGTLRHSQEKTIVNTSIVPKSSGGASGGLAMVVKRTTAEVLMAIVWIGSENIEIEFQVCEWLVGWET